MEEFENIDEYLKASDIVKMFIRQQEQAEENVRKNSRSDGIAKKGMSMAITAAAFWYDSAKCSLGMIKKELEQRIQEKEINQTNQS